MKTLINLERNAGIGTCGRHLMSYYARQKSSDSLYVVSPKGIDMPPGASNIYSHPLPRDPILFEDHTLISLKEAFSKNIDQLRRVMQEYQPDLVNCTGTYTYPWLVLNAALQEKLPVIVEVAGIIDQESEDPLRYEIGKEFIRPGKFSYIFPSDLAKRTLEKIHDTEFTGALVSPNGIGDVFFKQGDKTTKRESDLKIGTVGRFVPVKNFEYLGTLSDSLARANVPARIYCVADLVNTHDNYSIELHDQLAKKGIHFLDSMSPESLANFYQEMDLTLSPSHFETHGNTTLEAMAAGTPSLVSHNVGASEVIESLGMGNLIVDFAGNPEQVVETIKKIRSGELIVSDDVRARLRENYSWDSIFNKREEFRRKQIAYIQNRNAPLLASHSPRPIQKNNISLRSIL